MAATAFLDHRCNQLVAALVCSLRRTAGGEEGLGAFQGLLSGARALQAISYMRGASPRHTQTAPAAAAIPSGVSFNGSPRDRRDWRIERIRAGEGYVWQVPPVASGDGAGGNVAILSSLPVAAKGRGWRLILCSNEPEHDMLAPPGDIAKACFVGVDDDRGAKEITERAVEVEAHDCKRESNADCVPMPKSRRKTRIIVTISAWELGAGTLRKFHIFAGHFSHIMSVSASMALWLCFIRLAWQLVLACISCTCPCFFARLAHPRVSFTTGRFLLFLAPPQGVARSPSMHPVQRHTNTTQNPTNLAPALHPVL